MLRTDFCYYNDTYIVLKGIISVRGTNNAHERNIKLTFKNQKLKTDLYIMKKTLISLCWCIIC